MTISVDLPPEQAAKLEEAARLEGVDLAVLLVRIADNYLESKRLMVESAANYVLKKNAELYRRLAK